MARKILIISPTPTHPANAGNRIRILNMASFIIAAGHEVHFLFSRQDISDEIAMKLYWGDRLYLLDYKNSIVSKLKRIIRRIWSLLNPECKYYCEVDEYYNVLLDEKIQEIYSKTRFDIVIVEYIFLSKALLNFDHSVIKVIDTHDVMTDRHKLFLKEGKKPAWYSTPFRQEKIGILRADIVIAIQEKEKVHFSQMTQKPVINIGHFVQIRKANSVEPRNKILFVGSNNLSNLYGITDFINIDFPLIRKTFPALELLIAGNICSQLNQLPDGVSLLGELDDLSKAYDQADIVINPLTVGTGLKIKMIEALGYSKVVLSTPNGAEGLEEGTGESFLVYHNTEELLSHLKQIFCDSRKYLKICHNAANLASDWNNKNGSELSRIISTT